MMADFSLQALADEINNDPEAIGYRNGAWKGDQVIADLLNDPANGAQIRREAVPMHEIYAEVVWADFILLSDAKRQAFALITSTGFLDASSQNMIDAFTEIFGAGTTLTALNALTNKQGSRAEVLWGDGTTIAVGQVGRAANV
jgi:hypothetical protein